MEGQTLLIRIVGTVLIGLGLGALYHYFVAVPRNEELKAQTGALATKVVATNEFAHDLAGNYVSNFGDKIRPNSEIKNAESKIETPVDYFIRKK